MCCSSTGRELVYYPVSVTNWVGAAGKGGSQWGWIPRLGGSGSGLRLALSTAQPPWGSEGLPLLGCGRSQELMVALCLLQEKGRRESEGPKSRRRSSGRSPTSTEERMSLESASSLPDVSGRRAAGPVRMPRVQVCGWD